MKINNKYQILTPSGWQDFKGIDKKPFKQNVYEIKTKSKVILATSEHYFYSKHIKQQVQDFKVGDYIDTNSGTEIIQSITKKGKREVYDLIQVHNGNKFLANGVISSNCDEMAFVRPSIAKEFWTSISPTLSTGGKAIITSTPNSDEDQFALLWKGANKTEDEYGNQTDLGINGFKAYQADWHRHPDRDEKWAAEELGRIGEERFKREHLNQFLINEETLINATTLLDMEGKEPIRRSGQVRWYAEPKPGNIYTVALDPSLGTGGDPAAIQVFEVNSTTQIAEWKHNKTPCQSQIRILADIVTEINDIIDDPSRIYYSIENNTIGEAALISLDEYGEHNIPGVMLSQPAKGAKDKRFRKGFTVTAKSKMAMCAKLKLLIEQKRMTVNSKSLVSELKNFVAIGSSFAAKPGEHDDLVMATLLSIMMFRILKDYYKDLSSSLGDYSENEVPPLPFVALF